MSVLIIPLLMQLPNWFSPPVRELSAGAPLFRLSVVDSRGAFQPFHNAFRSGESFWMEGDSMTAGHVVAYAWNVTRQEYIQLEASQEVEPGRTFRIPRAPVKLTFDDDDTSERLVFFHTRERLALAHSNRLPASIVEQAKRMLPAVYRSQEPDAVFKARDPMHYEGWFEFTLQHRPRLPGGR